MRILILAALVFTTFNVSAAKKTPETPIGNPSAPKGGTYYINLASEPDILNPIYSAEAVTSSIEEYVMEPLLGINSETAEVVPNLADKWEVSKDGLTFTFRLKKGLKWSDGEPLTSEDVKFSVETALDPAFKAIQRRSYYEDIAKMSTPNPETIVFKMKKRYYKNLEVLGNILRVVPKHVYGDPNKPLAKVMIGSGPYKIEAYNAGKNIELVRNPNWWGYASKDPLVTASNNFDRITMRFIKEENLQLEMLKKGQLDYLALQPDQFIQKAVGAPFDTEIIKHKEENQDPTRKSYYFMGMNLHNPIFQDRKVRVALAELMNRQMMIEKFRFGLSDLASGPGYLRDEDVVDPSVQPLPYDPKHAAELLKKAGWEDHDQDGILDKQINGAKQNFQFSLLLPNRDYEKYFTSFKESLKAAGIQLEIKTIEWNAFVKLLNEQKFDAVALSWQIGSHEPDLKQIWHSSSAALGGSNFISYKNPVVDKLIDEARQEMNKKKRLVLWKKVYKTIAEDEPYIFMFSTRYDLYAAWKYIGMTKGTMKYDLGMSYWWKVAP